MPETLFAAHNPEVYSDKTEPYQDKTETQPFFGQTVLITGASRGIGAEITREFARQCASRIVMVSTPAGVEKANQVVDEIHSTGVEVLWIGADLSSKTATNEIIEALQDYEIDKVDVLVNNAGITLERMGRRLTREERIKVINTNYSSAVRLTVALADTYLSEGSSVINISSALGVWKDTRIQPLYSTTKELLIRMTTSMRDKLKLKPGVKINAIAPGFVKGENMTSQLPSEVVEIASRETPTGELVTENIVAKEVCRVANQAFRESGQVLVVDNGLGERTPQVIDMAIQQVRESLRAQAEARRQQRS